MPIYVEQFYEYVAKFQLTNQSFGHWISMLEQPGWFHQYRVQVEKSAAWTQMRLPLLLLVAAGSAFVTYLDHDGPASLITLLPDVIAIMPVMLARLNRQPVLQA